MRHQRITAAVIAGAALALVGAAVTFAATRATSSHYGYGMMGRSYVYQPAKATPVRTIAEAGAQAQTFADRVGLKVDEVLQFKDNFYAKLVDSQGNGATEVLVDPRSGAVSIEYGPAMMWNTKYGMGRAAGKMMGSYGRSMMRDRGSGMMGGSGNGGMMGSGNGGMMGGSGYGPGSAGGPPPPAPR